jgi:cytoskeletal protein RodZ
MKIDRKEAWESSAPDGIKSLGYYRLKELHLACEWYSKSKHTRYHGGFEMRTLALARELEHRRHRRTFTVMAIAAFFALLAAIGTWVNALRARAEVNAIAPSNNTEKESPLQLQIAPPRKSEPTPFPAASNTETPQPKAAPELPVIHKETSEPKGN